MTSENQTRALRQLCAADPDLARAVARFGPPPLWERPPGFATLVLIILEQQVSLASARATFERLRARAGDVTPRRVASLTADDLRAAGLTRQKAQYCAGLARRVVDGDVDLRRIDASDDGTAHALLRRIDGVGAWTADVYLLFALRRPDVWPRGDLALLRAIRELKPHREGIDGEAAAAIAEAWRPWRSTAARILWHTYLSTRGRTAAGP